MQCSQPWSLASLSRDILLGHSCMHSQFSTLCVELCVVWWLALRGAASSLFVLITSPLVCLLSPFCHFFLVCFVVWLMVVVVFVVCIVQGQLRGQPFVFFMMSLLCFSCPALSLFSWFPLFLFFRSTPSLSFISFLFRSFRCHSFSSSLFFPGRPSCSIPHVLSLGCFDSGPMVSRVVLELFESTTQH